MERGYGSARPSRAASSLRFGVAIWSDIAKDAVHLLGKTFSPFLRHGMEDRLDMPLDGAPVVAVAARGFVAD
jgi:hypothetical protein